ncbi:MAG: DUF1573 domain-containing protein [Bacteroidota bacterium]
MNKTTLYLFFLTLCFVAACNSNTSGDRQNDGGVSATDTIPEKLKVKIDSATSVTKNATISDSSAINIAKNIPDSTKIPKKEKAPAPRGSKINFSGKTHQYGTIQQGDKVDHTFTFTNTGDRPLNIQNAYASCGCTQPSFPFLPINPGKSGEIQVTFDSKGKSGFQKSKITIETDGTPKTVYLYLEGNVEVADQKTPAKEASADSTSSN